ncbi:hypothetical protein QWY85_09640 [Neolewinella lacunae]|uniref:Lipoprotein n=1 Tax=Neolewinella lacunae TaxID=1517758 RepID=A0A923PMC3_9BACT|nr:hypothetical protein [Neolewinella lacunae]MBC6994321.1 hypothetical protein [Neolewinella lacunae]MDN3634920.1 hypothetical protein [Neolewinella lacunae]
MIPHYLLLAALAITLCACNAKSAPETAAEPAPTAQATQASYPSIPAEKIAYLGENATYLDGIFYHLPISMNQDNLDQIRATLSTIAAEPATIPAGAKPIAHLWFQVNGKNVEEADLYFQDDIAAYVWYENGKPAYSNLMTVAGIDFYNSIINSVPK